MTIKELLARSVQRRGDGVALRYKQQERWHTVSYHELLTRVRRVAEVLSRTTSSRATAWPSSARIRRSGRKFISGSSAWAPRPCRSTPNSRSRRWRISSATPARKLLITNAKYYSPSPGHRAARPRTAHRPADRRRKDLPIRRGRIKYLGYEQLMAGCRRGGGLRGPRVRQASPERR